MRLRNLIGEIGAQYDRRLPMSSEAQRLLRQADVEFEQWIPAGYRAEGSGGRGRAAITPRIAVFEADETTTTRRGMYVAYLFAADLSTVALTLSQGIAELSEHLGRAGARRVLALEAAAIRAALHPEHIADLDTTIDLRSTAAASVDYEHGTILARSYRLNALPGESTMVADLRRFVRLYALALGAREEARQRGHQEILTPFRRLTARKKVAEVPEVTDVAEAAQDAEIADVAKVPEVTEVAKVPEVANVAEVAKVPEVAEVAVASGGGYREGPAEPETTVDRDGATDETVVDDGGRTGAMTRRGLLAAVLAVSATAFVPIATAGAGRSRVPTSRKADTAPRFTIDVSQYDWQRRGGNLDWEAVRKAGIVGMCARATYGDPSGYNYPSFHFGDFLRAAKAAGFAVRGGYHNLIRGDQASINRQVDWLRRELDAHDATWAMLDVERYDELVAANMWASWDDVRRFDDRWADVDHRVLVGYIPPWNWNKHLGQPDLRAFRGPLIASNYPLTDTSDEYRQLYAHCGGDKGQGWASYGNRVSEGWQYSSRAKVPGAASICDVNAWRLTFGQLKALLSGGRSALEELASTVVDG